jgi:hypothetical protein
MSPMVVIAALAVMLLIVIGLRPFYRKAIS